MKSSKAARLGGSVRGSGEGKWTGRSEGDELFGGTKYDRALWASRGMIRFRCVFSIVRSRMKHVVMYRSGIE